MRAQVWDAAQDCFNQAVKSGIVDKWSSICYVPKTTIIAPSSHYDERVILYWDLSKKQVLLVPVDHISGVETSIVILP